MQANRKGNGPTNQPAKQARREEEAMAKSGSERSNLPLPPSPHRHKWTSLPPLLIRGEPALNLLPPPSPPPLQRSALGTAFPLPRKRSPISAREAFRQDSSARSAQGDFDLASSSSSRSCCSDWLDAFSSSSSSSSSGRNRVAAAASSSRVSSKSLPLPSLFWNKERTVPKTETETETGTNAHGPSLCSLSHAFEVVSPFASLPRARAPSRFPLGPIQNSFRSNNSAAVLAPVRFGLGSRKGIRHKEAHLYRILHNRLLQWHFVNARSEATINAQRHAAEKSLHSMWAKTLELQTAVSTKCIKLQQAYQVYKLNVILSAQDSKLKSWCNLQQDHHIGLSRVVDALEAAVLRIPVTPGIRVDIKPLKEAIKSAVEVINSLGSVITFLLPKAEKMDSLVSKLAKVAGQERALLEQCGELREIASLYEVEERCLRTHLIQADKEKACVLGCCLLESNVASLD